MLQGIVLLAMAVGTVGLGAYGLGNTDEVCRRRAHAQGRIIDGEPSAGERRYVRALGIVSIVVGLAITVFAFVLIGQFSELERERRDLEDRQDQYGTP